TRAVVRAPRGQATVPLGVDLTMDAAVASPFDGEARRAGEAVVIEGAEVDLWLEGLEHPIADGPVRAGTRLGTVTGRLRVQLSRVRGVRPPFFVAPELAPEAARVSPDPAVLLGRTPSRPESHVDEVLTLRDAHFARV